ncbi:MAG: 3-oxoacyl-[acyl-carrier-protein] reductase [Bacteroidetes bacterium GWF2_33_16]|nr:MAG: 3-oxoacyl-[acyl-carrier-protein] reductase [Bacteroidetes bacterium GWE2_32_14]OFY03755.1 MAG: 3-oxoacyl-[acyl-carrier-protein] reductase [Bacteroidetes bacterium GWF2_33_16]
MKYALVTGGSRGIGKAICLRIAEMGYTVIINYKSNDEEANDTLNQIVSLGGNGELLKFDVSDPEQIKKAIENWKSTHQDQHIEILVNNAGIRKDGLIVWMKDEEWNDVISTNLNSFFLITRMLVTDMLVNKYGRIVNVVSLSGLKGLPGQTNYSAAKGGVIAASKALAQEIAKKNVTVNCVAPGFIKTDMTKELDENQLKQMIPMSRFGKTEEVADVVAFLASKKASYITGQVISVNGGLYT